MFVCVVVFPCVGEGGVTLYLQRCVLVLYEREIVRVYVYTFICLPLGPTFICLCMYVCMCVWGEGIVRVCECVRVCVLYAYTYVFACTYIYYVYLYT